MFEDPMFGCTGDENNDMIHLAPLLETFLNENVNQFADQTVSSAPPIPCTTNWKGDYNFDVRLKDSNTGEPRKAITWMYSKALGKLYVEMNKLCPFEIVFDHYKTEGMFLRAMPIYSSAEHVQTAVVRCPTHSSPLDPTNDGISHIDHILRAEGNVHYQTDTHGRHSVIAPLHEPHPGEENITLHYRFLCLSSCAGGMNRRPVSVLFTLEDRHGMVLGRKTIETRICACPVRDRKSDETRHFSACIPPKSLKLKRGKSESSNRPSKLPRFSSDEDADDEPFSVKLTFKSRRVYSMIMRLKQAFEISDLIKKKHPNIINDFNSQSYNDPGSSDQKLTKGKSHV